MTATKACGRHANAERRRRVVCRRPKAASETRSAKRVPPAAPPRPPAEAEDPDEAGSCGAGDPPPAGPASELAVAVSPEVATGAAEKVGGGVGEGREAGQEAGGRVPGGGAVQGRPLRGVNRPLRSER